MQLIKLNRYLINKKYLFLIVALIFFLCFSIIRFSHLTDRPMHNDESVNGYFMTNLIRSHTYSYNPENFHGPTLYYFQLVVSWVTNFVQHPRNFHFSDDAGLTVYSSRATIVLASLIVLASFFFLKGFIGAWGAFVGFLFMGLSADFLFYSRYFIHETYVVLFNMGILLGVVGYQQTKRAIYVYLTLLSGVFLFCTKETGVVHLGVMIIAFGLASALENDLRADAKALIPREKKHLVFAALLSVLIWGLLFSSFFKNPRGLIDSFKAYIPWLKQGLESGHNKVWSYYLTDLLLPYETGLLIATFIGLVLAWIEQSKRGLFLAFWTIGIFATYSLIPYKTPWLVINIILPMTLLSGYGFQTTVDWIGRLRNSDIRMRSRWSVGIIYSLLLVISFPLAIRVNYFESDSEHHKQPYVHTSRDIFRLLQVVDDAIKKADLGKNVTINIVSPLYWPIPFYWKQYPNVKFWGQIDGADLDASFLLAAADQHSKLRSALRGSYTLQNFTLRPGVLLDLWINNSVTDKVQTQLPTLDLQSSVNPPINRTSGLKKHVFSNEFGSGAPVIVQAANQPIDFYWEGDAQKPLSSPFLIRWTGFIKIPAAGLYRFGLDSDDGSILRLDNQIVIDNGGHHPTSRKTRYVNLSAGYHSIQLDYTDVGGYAECRLWWTPPNKPEEICPAEVFFFERL